MFASVTLWISVLVLIVVLLIDIIAINMECRGSVVWVDSLSSANSSPVRHKMIDSIMWGFCGVQTMMESQDWGKEFNKIILNAKYYSDGSFGTELRYKYSKILFINVHHVSKFLFYIG